MGKELNALLKTYFNQYKQVYSDTIFLDFNPEDIKILSESDQNKNRNPEHDLTEFRELIKDCQKCPLGKTRNNFVFGMGNPDAALMFVGEAPGEQEDLKGLPFVGRAGQLLDKILAAISLTRDEVYIANVLKCRPPRNRTPNTEEVNRCEPYLHEQIRIIRPGLIVALGRVAARTLLKIESTLGEMRKKLYSYQGVDLVVTYHPSALLRNPGLKPKAWEDFQWIQKMYLEKLKKT